MTRDEFGTIFLALVCALAAALCVKRFVTPWLNSKDKTVAGRAATLIQSEQQYHADRAVAFGSRRRTIWISGVNVIALCSLVLVATKITLWAALYPVVGFAMLWLCSVPSDGRLNARATWSERLSMRLFQAWSWPILVVRCARRPT